MRSRLPWCAVVGFLLLASCGAPAAGGDRGEWLETALAEIRTKYPRVHAVVIFNQPADVTLSTSPLDWSLTHDPRAASVVARAMTTP